MKLLAVSQRGAKRDFIDLFFVMHQVPFDRIANTLVERYGSHRINPVHIGKSIVFFDDAGSDPDPDYMPGFARDWQEIEEFFKSRVKQIVLEIEAAKKRI
ncbi:MAG: hypothetical protein M1548_09210 [Actinobacteria bacterium]|nr:hypothetical protein [Actinomycetota bacterium]